MKPDAKPSGGVAGGDVDKGGGEVVGGNWGGVLRALPHKKRWSARGAKMTAEGHGFQRKWGGSRRQWKKRRRRRVRT